MAYIILPWLLLTQLLLLAIKIPAKIPAVIVFGDSTVDTGNNNQIQTVLKSNFKPYGRDFVAGKPTGRFSNGRVPPDFISEAFGLKSTIPAYLDPMYSIKDFATGVCFASAGTGFDNATSDVLSVIPLWKEIEYYKEYQNKLRRYLGRRKANEILREAFYLVSIGTNDFVENYYIIPTRAKQYTVEEYQDFIIGIAGEFLTEIYRLGARKISIGGLPPMGCLPLERTLNMFTGGGSGCIEEYNKVAEGYNRKLAGMVIEIEKKLPGIKVVVPHIYEFLLEIIRKPSSFGFERSEVACCGTGRFEMSYLCNKLNPLTCLDANKYVFWDSFHPTERTNSIICDYLMKNVYHQFI